MDVRTLKLDRDFYNTIETASQNRFLLPYRGNKTLQQVKRDDIDIPVIIKNEETRI